MRRFFVLLVVALISQVPFPAGAAPVIQNTWYEFGFDGPGTSLTTCFGCEPTTNPVATFAPAPAWTFTLASAGTLTVLDLFASGDQFEILNFGAVIGQTSVPTSGGTCDSDITCALADNRYSRGIFALAAGNYSITGAQLAGISGAGVFRIDAAVIPLPASMLLLLSALGLTGGAARVLRRT